MPKFSSLINQTFQGARQGAKGVLRIAQTGRILSSTGLTWLLGDRPPTPRLLRQTFEKLGTTYIKLGQFIASSPSLFPEEYVNEFQHCLDNTPPVKYAVIEKILHQSLELPTSQLFSHIEREPLATASIAQVHAAKLLDGTDVVIKVQKPQVRNTLLTDLNFLYVAARLLEWLAPNFAMASLSSIIEEIQQSMLAECDFRLEAENLSEFSACIAKFNLTGVIAPKYYPQASSDKVLTMQRLYGVAFTDLEAARHQTAHPEQSLQNALNAWMTTLLMGHSFHADLHAGNLLVLDGGEVGFIDFGIVGKIRPQIWGAITRLIAAISMQNFLGIAEAMIAIGITKGSIDTAALAESLSELYASFDQLHSNDEQSGTDTQVNALLMQIVAIGKQHGIHFPREFALLLKQVLYFDRYLQLLAPDLDMFSSTQLLQLPGFSGLSSGDSIQQ